MSIGKDKKKKKKHLALMYVCRAYLWMLSQTARAGLLLLTGACVVSSVQPYLKWLCGVHLGSCTEKPLASSNTSSKLADLQQTASKGAVCLDL